jgi:hypothetical protein
MDHKWLLDMGYVFRLNLAALVTANYISEELKVLHVVIQDL